jgi:hypothetical protein
MRSGRAAGVSGLGLDALTQFFLEAIDRAGVDEERGAGVGTTERHIRLLAATIFQSRRARASSAPHVPSARRAIGDAEQAIGSEPAPRRRAGLEIIALLLREVLLGCGADAYAATLQHWAKSYREQAEVLGDRRLELTCVEGDIVGVAILNGRSERQVNGDLYRKAALTGPHRMDKVPH